MTYNIRYHADQWQHYQARQTSAGQWQIVHQDLGDERRLTVELHRAADGMVSITDARIEEFRAGRTGKLHWRTWRTLHPDEVIVEEQPDV
jgi:hypothetical protein